MMDAAPKVIRTHRFVVCFGFFAIEGWLYELAGLYFGFFPDLHARHDSAEPFPEMCTHCTARPWTGFSLPRSALQFHDRTKHGIRAIPFK